MLDRWLDPATGKLRTVWAFVMVLACSRHMFVRPVLRMDQRAWAECHAEAFAFFGGVPAKLASTSDHAPNPSASGRAAGTREHHCWTGHIIRAEPTPGQEPELDDMDVATREDGTALCPLPFGD